MSHIKDRLKQYKDEYSKYSKYDGLYVEDVQEILKQLQEDLEQDEKENILKWLKPSKPDETEMIEVADALVNTMMEIDEQPTAYDVDKVVKQLEKLADEANDKILEAGELQLYYDGYEDAMRTAVGIVKGGGAE